MGAYQFPDFTGSITGKTLELLIPPLMKILDDFETCNIILGAKALSHLLDEGNPSELRLFDQVIFNISKSCLNFRQSPVLSVTMPVMVKVLGILVPSYQIFMSSEYEVIILEMLDIGSYARERLQRMVC